MHSGCNTLYLNSLEHQRLVTDALLTPNQQCQSTEGNSSAFMEVNLKASKVQLMKSSHLI